METFHKWPLAHALGADDRLLRIYELISEGHLDQFQRAKAPSVEMARAGMFRREFPRGQRRGPVCSQKAFARILNELVAVRASKAEG